MNQKRKVTKAKTIGLLGSSIGGLVGLAAIASLYWPTLEPASMATTGNSRDPIEEADSMVRDPNWPAAGFQRQQIDSSTPIHSIRVLLQVGDQGEPLREPVNLHMGFGFPLRLYPLGTDSPDPSFAAFPTSSSLAKSDLELLPGDTAWFEFSAKQINSNFDPLSKTQTLFGGLTAGDIETVAFASRNQSDWVLGGYEIQVNGSRLVSHGDINASVGKVFEEDRARLEELLPELDEKERELRDREAFLKAVDNQRDRDALAEMKRQFEAISKPAIKMGGRIAGSYPWYIEPNDISTRQAENPAAENGLSELTVQILAAASDDAGTENPLFLRLGAKKFLVTSPARPLLSEAKLQEFTVGSLFWQFPGKFEDFELGMLPHDHPVGQVPDRAKIQRLIVKAGEETFYDSESNYGDRKSLQSLAIIPPFHRNLDRSVVANAPNSLELLSWRPGIQVEPQVSTPGRQVRTRAASEPQPPIPAETPSPVGRFVASAGDPWTLPPLPFAAGTDPQAIANPTSGRPRVASQQAPTPSIRSGQGRVDSTSAPRSADASGSGVASRSGVTSRPPQGTQPAGRQVTQQGQPGSIARVGDMEGASTSQYSDRPILSALARSIRELIDTHYAARTLARPLLGISPSHIGSQPSGGSAAGGSKPAGGFVSQPGSRMPFTQSVKPRASKGVPSIENIRFKAPRGGVVVFDQPAVVEWETLGDTGGVSYYSVDVFPIQPHRQNWFIPTLIAQKPKVTGTWTTLRPSLSTMLSELPGGAEPLHLFAQARVRAIGLDGKPIGNAAFSPAIPLVQGNAALPVGLHPNQGFEINGDGFSGPWNSYAETARAWPVLDVQSTHNALRLDPFGSVFPTEPRSQSFVVRPGPAETITVRVLSSDQSTISSAMRLIAHVGFTNSSPHPATAKISARVTASFPWELANPQQPSPSDAGLELFRVETIQPIDVAKPSVSDAAPTPLTLIDIPLQFDAPRAAFDQRLAGTPYELTWLNPSGGSALVNGKVLSVSATFMVSLDPRASSQTDDALGIFSIRLVPELSVVSPTPSNPVSSNPASSNPASSNPASSNPASSNPVPSNPVPSTRPLSPEIQAFLKVHNDARAAARDRENNLVNPQLVPLQWSDALARDAQKWADELAAMNKGLIHRNTGETTESTPYGENLAILPKKADGGPGMHAVEAAQMWVGEVLIYDPRSKDPAAKLTQRPPFQETGHYTQAVWSGTTAVGYGKAVSATGQVYVVATYDPPGNIGGEEPFINAPHAIP